jgi:hypothetical protein
MSSGLLLQAESPNNTLTLDSSKLAVGQNRIYVRMRTSLSCYTVSTNTDSIDITRTISAPQPLLSNVATEYCNVVGTQTFKLLNLPDTFQVSVTIKVDATILSLGPDSSFSISMNTLQPGTHRLEVKYSSVTDSKITTKDFTVIAAQTPEVNVTASTTTVSNSTPVVITATNVAGGGTTPLFTFGKDKNMSSGLLLQAESPNNTLTLDSSKLAVGQNRIFVRMKTSIGCYTILTDIDSVDITRTVATGIRDVDFPSQEITIYPNPLNWSFEVKGLQFFKTYSLTLTNSMGQIIIQKTINNRTEVSVSGILSAGTYWLTLYDKTKLRVMGTVPLIKK